jgi:hypothetical protein
VTYKARNQERKMLRNGVVVFFFFANVGLASPVVALSAVG